MSRRMVITLRNSEHGTQVKVVPKADLSHATARWDKKEDILYRLTPSQAKRIKLKLCGYKDCPCCETGILEENIGILIDDDGSICLMYHQPTGREGVINILIRRNGMSREDAERECDQFKENALYMIEQGYPLSQVEEEFVSYFGVEPDYLIDFIM